MLCVIVATLLMGVVARAAMRTGDRVTKPLIEQDTARTKPQLVIPDSLRASYKYTDALKQALIHNDTAAALKLYAEVLDIDSTFAPALYQLAQHEMKIHGREAQAMAFARRAYEQDTMSHWYADTYARSLVLNNRYDDALPLYRRLLKLDKNNPDNYRILAMVYQQRRQPYSAIAILDSADMRFGKMPYLSNMKRHLLITTGQMERAIEEAQESVEEAPYEVDNVISLAETYAAAKKDSLARLTYEQALDMDSTSVVVLGSYADFCSQQRDTRGYLVALQRLYALDAFPLERKIDLFKHLTQDRKLYGNNYFAFGAMATAMALRHPSDKRVVDIYGDHLIAGGDLDGALAHFKNHLADEPPQMDYYMAVIDIEDYKSRPDSVDLYVQRAVQLFPNDPVLYIRKANRQYVKGDLHGSVETFTEALVIAPTDSLKGQIWGYIGDTYHAMYERLEAGAEADTTGFKLRINQKKALKQCFESYEKALALYGDNVMTLNNYAYFLSESTDDMAILEEAMKMSARAIYLEKGNATYLDTFAWILYKLGRSEQARTHMRQALSLDTTESPELPLHYGDILFSLNERFMADTYWKKALEKGADKEAVEQRLAIPKDAKDKRVEDFLVEDKKKRR